MKSAKELISFLTFITCSLLHLRKLKQSESKAIGGSPIASNPAEPLYILDLSVSRTKSSGAMAPGWQRSHALMPAGTRRPVRQSWTTKTNFNALIH